MTAIPQPGTFLDLRSMPEDVGRRAVEQIQEAFGARYSFASLLALKAAPTTGLDDRATIASPLADVAGQPRPFRFDRFSSLVANDVDVLQPADVPTSKMGRWRQITPSYDARFTSRYIVHIQFVHRGLRLKDLWEVCRGKTPAVFVSFTGDTLSEQSQEPGVLYWANLGYRIRALSANWRGEPSSEFGSADATEAGQDPGSARVIGDIRWLFSRDNDLNNGTGISRIMVGGMSSEDQREMGRITLDGCDVTVHASPWVPNITQDLLDPEVIAVQKQTLDVETGETTDVGPLDEVRV